MRHFPAKHVCLIAASFSIVPLSAAEEIATDSAAIDPTADAPLASDLPVASEPASQLPSEHVAINLVRRLVAKGILTQAEAAEMIQQAEQEAAAAAARQQAAVLPPEPTPEEETRIAYIPEVVKNQMRDQIQQELMARAREEEWSKTSAPEWTQTFRPFGDIRVRSENTFFPEGNDNTGAFPNFNAINTGAPFDTSGNQFSPQYNVDQDRQRSRLRARFGTEISLDDGFTGGLRLATGESNSPTSPNQSLGGSGGNFSKYAIWLDRAFVSYDAGPGDGEELTLLLGRFDNPFLSTEIMWDDDLGFDGLAARGKVKLNDETSSFFTVGYFPVYNTDFNFASNQPAKFASTDKWLTGTQLGIEWQPADELTAKLGVAYHHFAGIEGKLSSPFIPLSDKDSGDTDTTRPAFSQRGNTYRALRNIDNSTTANDFGNQYQYQYYGLATPFEIIALTGRIDADHFDPVRISLVGEVIKNIAFDSAAIEKVAVNNRGPGAGTFDGGDTAWNLALMVGNPALETLWDWQVGLGYRYVGSDAVVDGFTDSDFGGGGTNVQGFILGGNVALSRAVRVGVRWMSCDEIAGPPLSTDTLQFDLNAKF